MTCESETEAMLTPFGYQSHCECSEYTPACSLLHSRPGPPSLYRRCPFSEGLDVVLARVRHSSPVGRLVGTRKSELGMLTRIPRESEHWGVLLVRNTHHWTYYGVTGNWRDQNDGLTTPIAGGNWRQLKPFLPPQGGSTKGRGCTAAPDLQWTQLDSDRGPRSNSAPIEHNSDC